MTNLHRGSNLRFRKIGALWAKKAEKVLFLLFFSALKIAHGYKILSPAWPQSSTHVCMHVCMYCIVLYKSKEFQYVNCC